MNVAFSAAQTATVDAVQALLIDGLLKRLTWGRRFCAELGNVPESRSNKSEPAVMVVACSWVFEL
jgi:hypothetical protein